MVEQEKPPQQLEYQEITGFGLTARQLWQLILLNALISTAISLLVVLVVGPWASTGPVSNLPAGAPSVPQTDLSLDGNPADTAPTPTPIPEPVIYEVQPGDVLSAVAQRFGVSMADIMAANGLEDPNTLRVGQSLLIPIGGLAGATATFTPIALPTETGLPFDPPTPEGGQTTQPAADITLKSTETPTPVPTATAPPVGVILVEVSNVLGYGQLEQETVTIFNQGPGVNLSGWKLEGSRFGDYRFPNLFLWNGGSVRIHTQIGTNTPSDLYWGQDEARWFSGDTVQLVDSTGEIIHSYGIP